MKSSDHKTVASQFVTFVGLTFALALGFFVVNQGTYHAKSAVETVLGTSTSHTSVVTKIINGDRYTCKRTNCGIVAHNNAIVPDENSNGEGGKCRAVKDNSNRSVCHWNNPIFTVAQCDGDKNIYRNKAYKNILQTPGGMNQAITEDLENIVYYNCAKITPSPTKKPTPSPTKRPTPTPRVPSTSSVCFASLGGQCGIKPELKALCPDSRKLCKTGAVCKNGFCVERTADPKPTKGQGVLLPSTQ